MIRVQAESFDTAEELSGLTSRAPEAGAVAAFVGLVRARTGERGVDELELDHHPSFTLATIEAIGGDARTRFALIDLTIVHRYGRLAPGEAIVFVAAAAEHRRAAFDAVDYLMDRLKTEAPFWKREHGPGGLRWIEARPSDHQDRGRWNEETP